jgi:hypothetical protein
LEGEGYVRKKAKQKQSKARPSPPPLTFRDATQAAAAEWASGGCFDVGGE